MEKSWIYCDNGHLWDRETQERCPECEAEENEQELDLIGEIDAEVKRRGTRNAREKLQLLRKTLTH